LLFAELLPDAAIIAFGFHAATPLMPLFSLTPLRCCHADAATRLIRCADAVTLIFRFADMPR
jgi:hypothetical protein